MLSIVRHEQGGNMVPVWTWIPEKNISGLRTKRSEGSTKIQWLSEWSIMFSFEWNSIATEVLIIGGAKMSTKYEQMVFQ